MQLLLTLLLPMCTHRAVYSAVRCTVPCGVCCTTAQSGCSRLQLQLSLLPCSPLPRSLLPSGAHCGGCEQRCIDCTAIQAAQLFWGRLLHMLPSPVVGYPSSCALCGGCPTARLVAVVCCVCLPALVLDAVLRVRLVAAMRCCCCHCCRCLVILAGCAMAAQMCCCNLGSTTWVV